jgi:hypothetical protein
VSFGSSGVVCADETLPASARRTVRNHHNPPAVALHAFEDGRRVVAPIQRADRQCARRAFGTMPGWYPAGPHSPRRPVSCGSRWPISPSFARSASESLSRPFNWLLRIRFSAARYSFRSSSSWSTVPVMKARMRAHSTNPPFARRSAMSAIDRSKKRSGQHAARLRRYGITPRLSYSFNFLTTREE